MNRNIKIPTLNDGKEFEMPKRKPKHRIEWYEKMIEIEKEKPDAMKKLEYRQLMEGAHLALIIIQEKFPNAKIDDILSLPDDIGEENNILQISCLAYGNDFDEIKKLLLKKTGDSDPNFRKTKPKTIK